MLKSWKLNVNKVILNMTTLLVLDKVLGEKTVILNILGYIFGISALVIWRGEIYKIISKKKISYKKNAYFPLMAIICLLVLIIMANLF
ncbi:Uncharacterised protein [Staphylococcus xylosus]|uniref:hypothetical protein n=1 Tax=Staphylococcus xylosus TaxID=1288 RepID=UPI00085CCC1C|nr:hypothetical protein [Staphylococcus xylosus]SCU36869.1 Uncharacterised protein [Staphylococcus xylosus]